MPTPSSPSTGVSFRTPTTATVSTHMFVPRRFSTFSHVSVRSQTRQTDRLRTKQHHRRQLDGEEQESRWKWDCGTRQGRSATDKDWPRQEGGLPRNADTWTRHCGRQPQIRSWSFRADTARQHFSHVSPGVKSQSRRFEEEAVTRLEDQVVRALAEAEELLIDRAEDGESLGRPVLKRSSAETHGDASERTVSGLSRCFAGSDQDRQAQESRHCPGLVRRHRRDLREPKNTHTRSGEVSDGSRPEASDAREIPKRQKDHCTHSRCGRGPPTSAGPPAGLAHARVPGEARRSSIRPYCGYLRSGVRVLPLVAGRGGERACHAALCRKQSGHVACTCCRRFPPRGRRSRVSPRTPRLLRCLCRRRGPSSLAKYRRWRRGDLGWFRVAPQLVPARDLSATCSLVYQVDTHYSRTRNSPHGQV